MGSMGGGHYVAHIKNSNNKWYTYKGDSCLCKYMSTPDAEFEISKKTELKVIVKSRCYTGINPCIDYSGPLRP